MELVLGRDRHQRPDEGGVRDKAVSHQPGLVHPKAPRLQQHLPLTALFCFRLQK